MEGHASPDIGYTFLFAPAGCHLKECGLSLRGLRAAAECAGSLLQGVGARGDLRARIEGRRLVPGPPDPIGGRSCARPGGVSAVTARKAAVNGLVRSPAPDVDGRAFDPEAEADVACFQHRVAAPGDRRRVPATGTSPCWPLATGERRRGLTSVRTAVGQQLAINGLGYSPGLGVDGILGPRSAAGVVWLQNRVGAPADGRWGPATEAAYATHRRSDASASDGWLTTIRSAAGQQRAVNRLVGSPALQVDGVLGPRTEAGVRWLQNHVGTGADGLWGPATEAAYTPFRGDEDLASDGDLPSEDLPASARTCAARADDGWGPGPRCAPRSTPQARVRTEPTVDHDIGPPAVPAHQLCLDRTTGAEGAGARACGPPTARAAHFALHPDLRSV